MPSIGAATAAHTADAMLARIGPDLDRQIAEAIGRVLHSMMDKSELFCGARAPTVRESAPEYFTDHRSRITVH